MVEDVTARARESASNFNLTVMSDTRQMFQTGFSS